MVSPLEFPVSAPATTLSPATACKLKKRVAVQRARRTTVNRATARKRQREEEEADGVRPYRARRHNSSRSRTS